MIQCFLDIDNTLLDLKYRLNSPNFAIKIKKYKQNGWYFHLNSNRSIEDMVPLYKKLSLNGWLVCENGSFGYQPREEKTTNIANLELLNLIKVEKDKLATRIEKIFIRLKIGKIKWITADTVEIFSSEKKINLIQATDCSYILFNNCYRKYSASIHVREGLNIKKPISVDLGDKVAEQLRMVYRKEKLPFTVVFSHSHGNILINLESVNKRSGVEWIKENFLGSLCAIGDEFADYKMIEGLGDFYTVSNAPETTKNVAILVSKKKYSAGVLDLINKINYELNEK